MSGKSYSMNDFYCVNCGHKGIPLVRANSKKSAKNHRKRMYCPCCKHTVNHVECRSLEEVETFLEDFEKGVYKEEANEELIYEQEHPRYQDLI